MSLVFRHIRVDPEGSVVVVQFLDREIRGEQASEDLQRELAQVAASPKNDRVVLDLSNVHLMTSAALVQLIVFNKMLEATGGRLILCHVRPEVYDVFNVMKLESFFQMEDDRSAAAKAFDRPPAPQSTINETSPDDAIPTTL
jgi:anti-sigma B factor antagonist